MFVLMMSRQTCTPHIQRVNICLMSNHTSASQSAAFNSSSRHLCSAMRKRRRQLMPFWNATRLVSWLPKYSERMCEASHVRIIMYKLIATEVHCNVVISLIIPQFILMQIPHILIRAQVGLRRIILLHRTYAWYAPFQKCNHASMRRGPQALWLVSLNPSLPVKKLYDRVAFTYMYFLMNYLNALRFFCL